MSKNNDWINPWVEFKLRLSAVNKINKLIDRAEPKAMVEQKSYDGTKTYYKCAVCGSVVLNESKFCHICGQAIDNGNVAF